MLKSFFVVFSLFFAGGALAEEAKGFSSESFLKQAPARAAAELSAQSSGREAGLSESPDSAKSPSLKEFVSPEGSKRGLIYTAAESPSPSKSPAIDTGQNLAEEAEGESASAGWLSFLSDPQAEGGISASWKAVHKAKHFSDLATISTFMESEFYGQLIWKLGSAVSYEIEAFIPDKKGSTQSIYDRDDRDSFSLLDMFFKWEPIPDFSIRAGKIQQDFLSAPLLITDRTFPGVLGAGSIDLFSRYELSFALQSAILDHFSSVLRSNQNVRAIPSFLSASISFRSPSFFFDSDIKESLTLFSYLNLTPDMAEKSRRYGNSVARTASDSSFQYPFFGLHSNFSLRKSLSPLWISDMGWEFIYNFLAPRARNQGARLYGSLYHNYRDLLELKWAGELFANQSDSSVAYYSSEIYGRNNRRGFLTKIQAHLYRSGLTLEASLVYSWPIRKTVEGPSFSAGLAIMTNYIPI